MNVCCRNQVLSSFRFQLSLRKILFVFDFSYQIAQYQRHSFIYGASQNKKRSCRPTDKHTKSGVKIWAVYDRREWEYSSMYDIVSKHSNVGSYFDTVRLYTTPF